MKKLLLTSFLCAAAAVASAQTSEFTTPEGLIYTIDKAAGTAVLTKVPYNETIKELNVPATITVDSKAYKVTEIGENACFQAAGHLNKVVIGENVTKIAYRAFYNCQEIVDMTLGQNLKTIGVQAFYNCQKMLAPVIPASVETIEDYAFYNDYAFGDIVIPSTVTKIGKNPWGGCSGVTKYSISGDSKNYTVVDDVLFDKNVTTLISYPCARDKGMYTVPSTVKVIGANSMRNNKYFYQVTLNEGLEEIGEGAFNVCSINGIAIPASVKKIGTRAFASNAGLREFIVADANKYYKSVDKFLCTKSGKTLIQGVSTTNLEIPAGVDTIGEYAFYSMSLLQSAKLNETKVISDCAFYNNSRLMTVDFGTRLDSIGEMAFMNCFGLTELKFPDTFRSIGGRQAFLQCLNLQKIDFGKNIQEIGDLSFMVCNKLQSVNIPASIRKIGMSAFSNCGALESVEIGEGITSLSPLAFANNDKLTTVKLPNSIKEIGSSAFSFDRALKNINLPTSLEVVDTAAFQYVPFTEAIFPESLRIIKTNGFAYTGLTKVELGKNLETIEDWAFGSSKELQTVKIADGLKTMGQGVFAYCTKLISAEIPATVTTIGDGLFANCSSISEIFNRSKTPQTLKADILTEKEKRYEVCKLTVPDQDAVSAYRNAPIWNKFKNISSVVAVDGIEADDAARIAEIYDVNGMRLPELREGINIVRLTNGKVKKMIVRK